MKAYKLFKLRKNGAISSLFINSKFIIPLNKWIKAYNYPTKGFAVRPGFHTMRNKSAPHLSKKNRVWAEVEIKDYKEFKRPENQGGLWYLSKYMRVKKILPILLLTISFNSVFGQLTITTNISQNMINFTWPVSLKNVFLYEYYHYSSPLDRRWRAMPEELVTSDGTNYYTFQYAQRRFWPTNVDYQLRPSFSANIVWPQATDTNLLEYDIHFVGTGGLLYRRVANKSQTSMRFNFLDPTMLPWKFYIYKMIIGQDSKLYQYEIKHIIITTTNDNNVILSPQNLYIKSL